MNEDIKQIEEFLNNTPMVENMTSSRGQDVPNQFIIKGNIKNKHFRLFKSYNSPIALFLDGQVYIFKNWDYSANTSKYRNIFLNETKKETKEKLKSGEYIAVDFEV